jgi:hypothetical protein
MTLATGSFTILVDPTFGVEQQIDINLQAELVNKNNVAITSTTTIGDTVHEDTKIVPALIIKQLMSGKLNPMSLGKLMWTNETA